MKKDGRALVNIDDPYGRRIKKDLSERAVTYSLKNDKADFFTPKTEVGPDGCLMDIFYRERPLIDKGRIPLTGYYNLYNALAAVSAAILSGIPTESVKEHLKTLPRVPGRLERYFFENGVCCIIDYAHTPDALENVLKTLVEIKEGKLRIVFGFGGNRYASNRPLMGAIAATYADDIYVTMDNPRNEDPEKIAEQIIEGINLKLTDLKTCQTIIDRKKAVNLALENSSRGDIVLVSGKGAEQEIIWNNRRIPYSDRETVLNWAREKELKWY